jgi:4-hydroxy-2-oxoheptanedioate aldolase
MEQFLREQSRNGRTAFGVWNSVGNALFVEAIATLGPDYVCVDMQHGESTEFHLVSSIQAIVAGGSTPIVRVPDLNPAMIMKALDAGARGIVVPLIESAEQAAQAVAACRFPPRGTRSFGPFRAAFGAGNELFELEKVACIVMIETKAGIEHAEEIVATEGVTAVYLGPSDLSIALGLPPASLDAPEFIATLDQILKVCARHDVVAGMHCYDGESAKRYADQGFGMVTVTVDLRLFRQALTSELAIAREG